MHILQVAKKKHGREFTCMRKPKWLRDLDGLLRRFQFVFIHPPCLAVTHVQTIHCRVSFRIPIDHVRFDARSQSQSIPNIHDETSQNK